MSSAPPSGILSSAQTNDLNLINLYPARLFPKYICVGTQKEVEDEIRRHSEETFSNFVVAKKTKAFGRNGNKIILFS